MMKTGLTEEEYNTLVNYLTNKRECDVPDCFGKRVACHFRNGTPFAVCTEHDNGNFIPTLEQYEALVVRADGQPIIEMLTEEILHPKSVPPGMGD